VDLKEWISTDHASVGVRLDNAIVAHVGKPHWKSGGEHGGSQGVSSIAWLLFHTTFHQDLAMNTAIRNHAPMLPDHREALGIGGLTAWAGLTEAEDGDVTEALHLDALLEYVAAVNAGTADWIDQISLMALDSIPDSSRRLADKAGIPADGEMSWLHAMWSGKPVSWFVQWECIGHGHAHVGEMVGVRNRLGFSPF
jgi:hypothetical protein